jgi:DDE superfamily endonuclease
VQVIDDSERQSAAQQSFTKAGLVLAHPRFVLHFTPTSSSWLNLVERWFSKLTTKKLRRGAHRSVRQLKHRHPRMDRHLERRPKALRLDQDRRPDPRINRHLLQPNQRITTLVDLPRAGVPAAALMGRCGRVGGEGHRGRSMTMGAAAQVDEGDEWCGGVQAEAAVADDPDAIVEVFEASVGEAEADCGEDGGAVAADRARELDERCEL